MAQEKKFAKKHGMRQTLSSGRFGIMKGDAFDSTFVVDNKQTMAWEYGIDSREWAAFAKRAMMVRRLPAIQIDFLTTVTRIGEGTAMEVKLVVMNYDDWERMYQASGWNVARESNPRDQRRDGRSQRGTHKAAAPVRRGRTGKKD